MINIIGNIVFIIIMLFIHLIILNTQNISSKDYFYGVYIKNLYLDNEFKNTIDKNFKSSINKGIVITIVIYFIIEFIFNINKGIDLFFLIALFFYLVYIYLKKSYENVNK